MTVHTHQQCFHSSRWKSPSVQIPPKQGAQLQMNKTVPASSFRGSGHTLRTEAGNSRFIEEAPPRAFSRERISTLRRSAYREEEAGVSRKVKAQCTRQHIKLCQPREILTPRMSRESLCDMGGKDDDQQFGLRSSSLSRHADSDDVMSPAPRVNASGFKMGNDSPLVAGSKSAALRFGIF